MNDNEIDIDWWNAFKQGDRAAFDNLFRRYYPLLLQYGSRICSDQDVLEDAIQDLFIELWQSKTTTTIQSVKAYFLKALKYKLYRHFKNQSSSTPSELLDNASVVISHDHFIVQQESEAGQSKKITKAINQLPGRQKEIIYLKIYQELSYEEISEIMNINYQVARNLFHQSIKSLRLLLPPT